MATTGNVAEIDASKLSQKELEALNKNALSDFYEKVLVPCPWCGRTFLEDKLKIHNRSCTEEHPAKRVGEGAKPRTGVKIFGEFHPTEGNGPSSGTSTPNKDSAFTPAAPFTPQINKRSSIRRPATGSVPRSSTTNPRPDSSFGETTPTPSSTATSSAGVSPASIKLNFIYICI